MSATGSEQNQALVLASYPIGMPVPGKDLIVKTTTIDLSTTEPPPNGIFTKNHSFSLDPYQRGRMRPPTGGQSYVGPYPLGQPITNHAVSTILKSNNSAFSPGDVVIITNCPIETYTVHAAENINARVRPLKNPYSLDPKHFLGALGMPGLTAYSSLYEIGAPQAGETIFISAASGAVGALVGQLAKRAGLHVLGSVGSDDKLRHLTDDLGFDGGFNYKTEKAAAALSRLAPKGVDIYYDNVGGEQLEAALSVMNDFGRVIACGAVSQYNLPFEEMYGVRNLILVVGKRLKMQGFIVGDKNMGPKYFKEHQENVQKWLSEGSVKGLLSVTHGMENGPQALVGMLKGDNFGKTVLTISEVGE